VIDATLSICFCSRVKKRAGERITRRFTNPVRYIFDDERVQNGSLEVRRSIPYSDLTDLDENARQRMFPEQGQPLEFGHSLEDQIGGQLDAGLTITGSCEDRYDDSDADLLSEFLPTFMATSAVKP
jgi:hypothetical protein